MASRWGRGDEILTATAEAPLWPKELRRAEAGGEKGWAQMLRGPKCVIPFRSSSLLGFFFKSQVLDGISADGLAT